MTPVCPYCTHLIEEGEPTERVLRALWHATCAEEYARADAEIEQVRDATA